MAVEIGNVQTLMGWLTQDGSVRSGITGADTLVEKLAALLFQGDVQWPERTDQADNYAATLDTWFATDSGGEQQFVTLTASDADPAVFVDWFLPVVEGWESLAAGQQSAEAQGYGSLLGDAPGRYSEAAKDDNYGLTYRYDHHGGVYEWFDEGGQTWRDQVWADQQHAAGGHGSAGGQGTAGAQAPAASAHTAPAATWDENWKMFYRVNTSGAYQFADAVTPGVEASGCGDTWLSQEQVAARSAGAHHQQQAAAAQPHEAAAADAVHQAMLAAVGSVFEADPLFRDVLTDAQIHAVLTDVARELIGN